MRLYLVSNLAAVTFIFANALLSLNESHTLITRDSKTPRIGFGDNCKPIEHTKVPLSDKLKRRTDAVAGDPSTNHPWLHRKNKDDAHSEFESELWGREGNRDIIIDWGTDDSECKDWGRRNPDNEWKCRGITVYRTDDCDGDFAYTFLPKGNPPKTCLEQGDTEIDTTD